MGPVDGMLYGLGVVLTFKHLLAAFAGALAGTAIGVLPGLGPATGVALVLPITYALDPIAGVIMMAGIYYGAMYGGSTTSILVNMPGEAASVITCIDGYKMTQKGRAGAALTIVAVGSFLGGTVSVLGIILFAPPLAQFGLKFGPAEFFALIAGGLILFSRISGGTLAGGVFPLAVGMVLGTIGQEPMSGQNRFMFGVEDLSLGISMAAMVVGVFGVTEIMTTVESTHGPLLPIKVGLRDLLPTRSEWRRSWAPFGRGTLLGFFFGLVPGPHAALASFASYRLEKAVSKHREELGEGAVEGVAGPESANNAAATSVFVPLLALGIPFGTITAMMLSTLIVHGVQPGPLLMTQHPEIFWGLIVSMYVGNVMLLILNVPMISVWVSMLRIPHYIFLPIILMLAFIGAYSIHNSMLDIFLLVLFGGLGYVFNKLDFQLAPMVVGLVLGPLLEKHLREGLFMSFGELAFFYTSPIAITIWVLVLIVVVASMLISWRARQAR